MTGNAPDPLLHVTVLRSPAAVVIRLTGELDYSTAPLVDESLRQLAREQPPPARIVLDADQLTFVDVGGLSPLIHALQTLPPGTLRMRNARPGVVRIVRLLDLANALGLDA